MYCITIGRLLKRYIDCSVNIVDLCLQASVELALLRDRETINGRPMFISVCKESKTDDNEGTTENREPIFKVYINSNHYLTNGVVNCLF